jgi:hypothetical protein
VVRPGRQLDLGVEVHAVKRTAVAFALGIVILAGTAGL